MTNSEPVVALRCHIDEFKETNRSPNFEVPQPSESLVLVFDCETTIDKHQNLTFGSCHVYVDAVLREKFIF